MVTGIKLLLQLILVGWSCCVPCAVSTFSFLRVLSRQRAGSFLADSLLLRGLLFTLASQLVHGLWWWSTASLTWRPLPSSYRGARTGASWPTTCAWATRTAAPHGVTTREETAGSGRREQTACGCCSKRMQVSSVRRCFQTTWAGVQSLNMLLKHVYVNAAARQLYRAFCSHVSELQHEQEWGGPVHDS